MLTRNLSTSTSSATTAESGSPTSWEKVLQNQPEESILATSKAPAKARFANGKSIDDCKEAALTAPLSTFLVKLAGVRTPALVHSFVECRSTSPDTLGVKSYGVHHGTGLRAQVFTIDPDDFFLKLRAEDPLDFESLSDIEEPASFLEAKQIQAEDGKVPICDMRKAMFVPPEVACLMLNPNTKPEDHATTLIEQLKDKWDTAEAERAAAAIEADPDGKDREAVRIFEIQPMYHDILMWLYKFSDIPEINTTMVFTGSDMSEVSIAHELKFFGAHEKNKARPIEPIETLNPSSIAALDPAISNQLHRHATLQSEALAHFDRIASNLERSGSSRRGFDKLPKITKNMILMGGSKDGSAPALDITAYGRELFEARTDTEAHIILEHSMKAKGLYYAKFTPAQAKAITTGNWLWNGVNPSGISMLLFCPYNPSATTSLEQESMVLHLKTKFGMDPLSLKSLTESDVIIPSDVTGLIRRIKLCTCLMGHFYEDSLLERNLEYFVGQVHQNMELIEQMISNDRQFIPKLLCAVDKRINQWFTACSFSSNDLANIDLSIINFYEIMTAIQRHSFVFEHLPPCLHTLHHQEDIYRGSGGYDGNGGTDGSGRKRPKNDNSTNIQNPNPDPRWKLKNGENYGKIFGRIEDVEKRPKGACMRYHIKGYCFRHCKHPHCPLPQSQDNDMLKYMKYCRETNGSNTRSA